MRHFYFTKILGLICTTAIALAPMSSANIPTEVFQINSTIDCNLRLGSLDLRSVLQAEFAVDDVSKEQLIYLMAEKFPYPLLRFHGPKRVVADLSSLEPTDRKEMLNEIIFIIAHPSIPHENLASNFANFHPRNESQELLLSTALAFASAESSRSSGLFLSGEAGNGKTHLSIAIAKDAQARGKRVFYFNPEQLPRPQSNAVGKKGAAWGSLVYQDTSWKDADLIVIDDLNRTFLSEESRLLRLILASPRQKPIKVIVTSNEAFGPFMDHLAKTIQMSSLAQLLPAWELENSPDTEILRIRDFFEVHTVHGRSFRNTGAVVSLAAQDVSQIENQLGVLLDDVFSKSVGQEQGLFFQIPEKADAEHWKDVVVETLARRGIRYSMEHRNLTSRTPGVVGVVYGLDSNEQGLREPVLASGKGSGIGPAIIEAFKHGGNLILISSTPLEQLAEMLVPPTDLPRLRDRMAAYFRQLVISR